MHEPGARNGYTRPFALTKLFRDSGLACSEKVWHGLGVNRSMQTNPTSPNMIHWAITFALLSFVTTVFALGGTSSEYLSLLARVMAVIFLGMAVAVMFRKPRNPGTH